MTKNIFSISSMRVVMQVTSAKSSRFDGNLGFAPQRASYRSLGLRKPSESAVCVGRAELTNLRSLAPCRTAARLGFAAMAMGGSASVLCIVFLS